MKVQSGWGEPLHKVDVKLSRRNLLALLHKLDWKGSERAISKSMDGVILTVEAENDREHYGDEEAGVMADETEQFIDTHHEPFREDEFGNRTTGF